MTDDGPGIGVLVVRIGVDGSLSQQVVEAIFSKTCPVTVKQVSAQPVNSNLQHQPDVLSGLCAGYCDIVNQT